MKNTSKILALLLVIMTVLMSLSAINVSAAGETYTVAGEAGLCGLDWNTSYTANDMTYDEATGTYTKVFENVAAGTYQYKVVKNHNWGTGEFPTSGNYSVTVPEGGATVTIKWTPPSTLEAILTVNGEEVVPEVKTTKVYVKNDANWAEVYCYYWGGVSNGWPGAKMDFDAEKGLYYYEIPAGGISCIFNKGTGGVGNQTPDLVTPTDDAVVYNNSTNAWGTLEGDVVAPEFIIAGSDMDNNASIFGTGWDTSNVANLMTLDEETGVYTIVYDNVPAGSYKFKATRNGSWTGAIGDAEGGDADGNYLLTVPSLSKVTITCKDGDTKLTVTVEEIHEHSYEAVVTLPTCTDGGYTTYTCSCGDSYVANEVAALGHSHEAVVTLPTCTERGYTTYTCSCGDAYVADEVEALGHSYAEGVCGTCGAVDPDYVAPEPPAGDVTMKDYIFDPNELGEVSGLNDPQIVGNGFFTLNMSNSKNESKVKTFEDGYASTFRFSLNGTSKLEGTPITRSIQFTTTGKGKVTIWWELGNTDRTLELYNSNLELVASTSKELAKGIYITTFEFDAADTYYLAHTNGTVYFYKVVVSVEEKACEHDWADATCQAPKTCKLCGETEGEVIDHNYVDGSCAMCGAEDPSVCKHPNMQDATCELPKTCPDCGATEGEALGHSYADATCTAPKTCTVCGGTDGKPLGHTYEFVTTLPTFEIPGKTTVKCLVCDFAEEFGAVNVMGAGQHVLDASALDGIGAGDFYDGKVTVIDGKFACHLSTKYKTESNAKDFVDGYAATHRMNFGGKSEWTNNGEGDDAVRNGGLKNFIEITTSGETTITVYWVCGGNGRQVGIYTVDGTRVAVSEGDRAKNSLYISEFTLEAGTYLIGTDCENAESGGGNYFYKIVVDVKAEEQACAHDWADATCESPKTCKLCGETEGEALGHSYEDGACSVCGDEDPNYVPPVEEPVEKGFFARIWEAILNFIQKLLGIFNKK